MTRYAFNFTYNTPTITIISNEKVWWHRAWFILRAPFTYVFKGKLSL